MQNIPSMRKMLLIPKLINLCPSKTRAKARASLFYSNGLNLFGIIILIFFLLTPGTSIGQAPTDPFAPFRIGLLKLGFPSLFYLIPSDGKIEIYNEKTRQVVFSGPAKVVLVRSDNRNGMQVFVDNILQAQLQEPLVFSPVGNTPHHIWIGSQPKLQKAYRASIMIFPSRNRLGAVNIIPLDDYLRSVVPSEIGNSCPFPALAAQAIAARTYALRNMVRHSPNGFNLCDDVHCQAYNGLLREHPASTQSVEATRNIVLMYDGRFANTVYHSTCGGKLFSCDAVWGGKSVPYLVGHEDRIGNGPPFCEWAIRKNGAERASAASKEFYSSQTMLVPKSSLFVPGSGKAGPGKSQGKSVIKSSVTLKLPDGNPEIKRGIVFPGAKSSTPISFLKNSRGHRVGMCQDGAVGMARQGYSANDILSFYYPHTVLQRIDPSMKMAAVQAETKVQSGKTALLAPPPSPAEAETVARDGPIDDSPGGLKLTAGKKSRDFRKWYWCNIPVKAGEKVRKAAFKAPVKKEKSRKFAAGKSKKKSQKT